MVRRAQLPAGVEKEAAAIAASVEAIGKIMRRAAWDEARRLPVPLTGPQLSALRVLVEAGPAGLPLSTLSRRLGLAHSTTSGVVDRLERLALVRRVPNPDDRRFVLVQLTDEVATWLEEDLPARKAGPIAEALRQATPEELAIVRAGIAMLEELVARESPPSGRT